MAGSKPRLRTEWPSEAKPVQMEFVGVQNGKFSFRQNGQLFRVKPKGWGGFGLTKGTETI